ncbi:Geranylgeranyl transferase type-1 subunit beta [Bienertia sinuspersici]
MESELSKSFSVESWFDKDRHIRFLHMMLDLLPSGYQAEEINHLTLAYFALSSLDILGALDQVFSTFNFSLKLLNTYFSLSIHVSIDRISGIVGWKERKVFLHVFADDILSFVTLLLINVLVAQWQNYQAFLSLVSSCSAQDASYPVDKKTIIAWVLSFQAYQNNQVELSDGQFYGFVGSRSSQFPPDVDKNLKPNGSHLASTYSALAILKIIGYDFSLFDSKFIVRSMRHLQQHDGRGCAVETTVKAPLCIAVTLMHNCLLITKTISDRALKATFSSLLFMPIHIGAEADLRFVYCAAAISYLLDDWTGVDKLKAKEYILNCQSYDGGFGLCPGLESHGGATYCAIASLQLMGYLGVDIFSKVASSSVINIPMLLDWMMQSAKNQRVSNQGKCENSTEMISLRPNPPSYTSRSRSSPTVFH